MKWNSGLKKLASANGVDLHLYEDQLHEYKIGARPIGSTDYHRIIGSGRTITEARDHAREHLEHIAPYLAEADAQLAAQVAGAEKVEV